MPGLAVDRYADVAIVQADSFEIARDWLPDIEGLLPTGYVKVHPRAVNRLTAEQRLRLAPEVPTWGPPRGELSVNELGVQYLIRPGAGLSVGLFLDMREVRQWLRETSQAAQAQVLNLFAYTCSLGVCAALGGARRVVNLDVSRPYLEWGKANYALNGLEADPHDFIYGDAFDWLRRFARRAELFDVVIVDPPSYSSTPFSVIRDYPRLVEAASRVVSPGGILLAATNHATTSDRRFDDWLRFGVSAAGRQGRIVRRWHEPEADFSVPPGGRPYLKVRALELA